MNTIIRLLLLSSLLSLCISCEKSTSKYAQKEHGAKFDRWELYYTEESDIYWPALRLSEPVAGNLTEIEESTRLSYLMTPIHNIDTTSYNVTLNTFIENVKDDNDATRYDLVTLHISDIHKYFIYHFVFNEGQNDSVSFEAVLSDYEICVNKDISSKIIALISGKKPVTISISYEGTDYIWGDKYSGTYYYELEGSPLLKKGLEINKKRSILADKEYSKIDFWE